jgi:hypothetical protein
VENWTDSSVPLAQAVHSLGSHDIYERRAQERYSRGWQTHLEVFCTATSRVEAILPNAQEAPSQKVIVIFLFLFDINPRTACSGIGQGRITNNLATEIEHISGALHIPDSKSIAMLYELLDKEGLYLGASSALNVVAAVELAQKLGRGVPTEQVFQYGANVYFAGSTVATILCDGAYRYQSRIFSKKWLQAKGLTDAIPTHLKKYAVLD